MVMCDFREADRRLLGGLFSMSQSSRVRYAVCGVWKREEHDLRTRESTGARRDLTHRDPSEPTSPN